MNRFLRFAVVFMACLLLTACASNGIQERVDLTAVGPQDHTQRSAPNSTNSTVTPVDRETIDREVIHSGEIRISATTTEEKQTYRDEQSDVALLQTQIQCTTVSMPDNPAIEQHIAVALAQQQTHTQEEIGVALSTAQADYETYQEEATGDRDDFYGYSYYTIDTIHRLDTAVFSLSTYYSSYLGGTELHHQQTAATFALDTGLRLNLYDILLPEGQERLQIMVQDWFLQRADTFGLASEADCIQAVEQKYGSEALNGQYTDWYLTNNSLVLFFNPYEISPYAASIIKITFTEQELNGLIKPGFLNSEKQNGGNSAIVCLNGALAGPFATVDNVVASTGDCSLEITSNETLYDISLVEVSWVGQEPVEHRVLYAANYLSAENLIVVELASVNELNNLCLRLEADDGSVQYISFRRNLRDGEVYTFSLD